MFDHVVLRRAAGGDPVSVGEIVEALLYYQRVHVVVDRGSLFAWLKQVGPEGVLTLIRRPELTAVYCEEMLGARTDQVGPLQVHMLEAFWLSGHESIGPLKTPEDRLSYEVERITFDKGVARRFAKNFLRHVPIRKFSGSHFAKGGISTHAKQDVLDSAFMKDAVRTLIRLAPCGYDPGPSFRFDVIDSDLGLYVFHDIDIEGINARRAASIPQIDPMSVAHILAVIQDARADLSLASFYSGDFVTSQVMSEVIRLRHESLLRRTELNAQSKTDFVEIVLPDSPSLSEVIDAGERSLSEALKLLDQAARFKDWLKTANPDEGLIRTYMRDISSEGWIQRLPAKSLRYMLTLALDATHPVAGFVAGFADNFLIEKLLAGWRPNHFIASKLAPFIKGS